MVHRACRPCVKEPSPSLLDILQPHLPLAQNIVPRLPLQALAFLACTCRSLCNILDSDWLNQEWWLDQGQQALGLQHPVFHQQVAKPGRDQIFPAIVQYLSAVKCMQASRFKQGGRCYLSKSWWPTE